MSAETSVRPFAVVTGASRGIGAEYCRALAARGHDVLLVSRDRPRMEHLASELIQRYAVEAPWEILDLSEEGAAHRLYAAVRQRRPMVDVLVNNAGFGLYGPFLDMPIGRLQEMVRLHINAVVESVRLFLPGMVERGAGTIINVASLAGMFSIPYFAHYAATKAFLISFSEAVALEVERAGVHIQVCCPGSTETDFHATAGSVPKDPVRSDSPAQVVAASLAGLQRGRRLVTVGWKGGLYAVLSRLVPRQILLRATAAFMKLRPG